MSKISDYSVVSIPKLEDKLIGTSIGGVLNNKTYNFTLQQLQDLFLSNVDILTVKDFGAIGDGITDDTAAIQEAISYFENIGGVLIFPVGTYKVTSEITQTFSNNVNFKMIGYGAIIDGSTSNGTNLFTLQGQQSTSSLLSASPNKMDTSISTTTSIGAVANDFIMLQSTDLWCPARPYYYKGELCQVLSTSGTTYNLGSQLFDGYAASTTTAYKLIMPTIEIEGMEFVRNSNLNGINIQYATNVSILNCKIHGARYTALSLTFCYGGLVQNNQIYDCWNSTSGTSYGVSVASCQFVKVANNTLSEARHCITTGGTIPSRSHIYIGNSCLEHPSQGQSWAIDTHGNTEFITIEGNYANGTVISGRSATIIGNTFIGILPTSSSSIVGTIVLGPEDDIDNIEIRDNSVTSDYSFTNASGIVLSVAKANGNYNNIIISNNRIKVSKSAIYFGLVSTSYTNNIINNLEISDNHFETDTSYCFLISGTGTIGYTINKLTSNNNYYYSNYSSAVIGTYNEVKIAYFTNDRFYSGANGIANTSFSGLDEAIFTNCRWEGNVTGLGNAGDVYINGTGKILNYLPITNNISRINVGTSVTDYLEQGRTGNILSSQIPSTTRYINGYSRFGYAFAYATSIPTTGTWNQYDEIYNTNNAIGNPLKWVCDTAGTPGTWRAIYTIETYPTYDRINANLYITGYLGIGTTASSGVNLVVGKTITGAADSIANYQIGIVQSDVTNGYGYRNELRILNTTFTLNQYIHYYSYQSTFGSASVTTQAGFGTGFNMTSATNNYGFWGTIPTGSNNNWNLYMSGTASNYMAGSLGIGSTSLTGYNLRISKAFTNATATYGINIDGTIQSDVTSTAIYYSTSAATQAASFTLTSLFHYRAAQGTIGSTSAVTNQYGIYIDSSLTGATNNYGFYGQIASGTGRYNLYMSGDADNFMLGRLGIGASAAASANVSLRVRKTITGSVSSYGILNDGIIQSDVTTGAYYFASTAQTLAAAFTLSQLYHFQAGQSTIGSGSTVTSQYGFYVANNLIGATNNYGFYGNLASAANAWNLYMSGSASNYLRGSLGIGSTNINASAALQISSSTQGFLPPVMTTTQKNAISSPATGLVVFDSTLGKLCVYGGSVWQTITSV